MSNIDISLLRAFAAAADRGTMTAGARALNLTQGAISQKIARLEALAGQRLLTRERQRLRLTPEGERLLGKVRLMLELNDDLWAQMNGGRPGGIVRLGLPVDLISSLFAPILRRFTESFPAIELKLYCGATGDLEKGLADGRFDVVVLEQLATQVGDADCLLTDSLVWVGMPGGAAHLRHPLPLSLVSGTCCFRPEILAALRKSGRDAKTVFEDGGFEATMAVVRMDMAISAWLASTVPDDLHILDAQAGLPELPFYAVTLHSGSAATPSRATDELKRHFREAFSRLSSCSAVA
ncbi:hypothetical protein A8A54_19325 [Brucella pseudogrignonensis]|uniref:LysR family transcriptional regulator n=1 Tax=Brucella pseudogrignonensis TaxID=419475 RepID=UPI0007DA874D|nr:LysR family transcriptional regulator [Brucella pseudogrignonensis]ANG98754.1 hypothetical protein A8A54_19325 [Brucella pseudogrignonensis]